MGLVSHRLRVERCPRRCSGHGDERERVPLRSVYGGAVHVDVGPGFEMVAPGDGSVGEGSIERWGSSGGVMVVG